MRIIITGAGSGIGAETARSFAGAGAKEGGRAGLFLVDRNPEGIAALAQELGGIAQVHPFVADLADRDAPDRIIAAAEQQMGGIDVLVSNAGVNIKAPLEDFTPEDFDLTFAVNTRATWALARAARPALARAKGCVIAVTSIAGHHPGPGVGAYSASKAALLMLVRQMAAEWSHDGIRFNSVSPGTVVTGLSPERYRTEEQREIARNRNPLGILGMPEHLAGVIRFLASPEAAYINGSDLIVDGGKQTTLMKA